MNIQNLKENILVKKVLPILKILDFRQYFFAYLLIINPFIAVLFFYMDIDKLINIFSLYVITFFGGLLLFRITPLFLIAEIIIRALLKKFFPNNQILLNLESIPQKMTLLWSLIFYILFILSVLFSFIVYVFDKSKF